MDFPKVWRQKCHMCFQEDTLLYVLGQLVAVLEARKKWFDDAGCDNLDAFNKATGEGLPRLVFACDEVAELLDRTGRSKEDRDKLNQIENRLATLARLGRAFGIHLILATSRPDANILPAKSRTTWISGYAAGPKAYCPVSSWTTPAPPNRYPRTQEAASSLGTGLCSKPTIWRAYKHKSPFFGKSNDNL